MVIIKERQTRSGGVCYDLEEVNTGEKKTWYPPRNLEKSEYNDKLQYVVAHFDAAVKTKAEGSNQSTNILDASISCNAETLLKDYVEQVFMPRRIVTIAEHTRDSWQRCLDLRILPALGSKTIGSITASQLTDFLLGVQAEGLAKSSVDKYHTILKGIFRMAYSTDVILSDPMEKVDKPRARKDELISNEVDAHTASEIAYIESCLEKEPLKWRVLIHLLNDTGMRIGECCAISWNDIDFQRNAIAINRTLNYTPKKGIYFSTPKNRKKRVVFVSNDVMYLLLLLYRDNVWTVNSPYVFHQDKSQEPIHPQSPGKYLKKFQEKYGIPHMYPHKLRHSYASIAITNGADVASVAENLGHKDKSVTLRMYTAANETSKRHASDIRRNAVRNAVIDENKCVGF